MEPRGASDIDGQTDRSTWAGAHESKRGQRTSFNQRVRLGDHYKTDRTLRARFRGSASYGSRLLVVVADLLAKNFGASVRVAL
jgi:hypothetical protein